MYKQLEKLGISIAAWARYMSWARVRRARRRNWINNSREMLTKAGSPSVFYDDAMPAAVEDADVAGGDHFTPYVAQQINVNLPKKFTQSGTLDIR